MTLPLLLRPPQNVRELNFVRKSWTLSACKARPAKLHLDEHGHVVRVEQMPPKLFVAGHAKAIDRILLRARVLVADPTSAPGTLAGWVCWEPGLLHYVYVGQTFRRMGVARLLVGELAEQPMTYATWTPVVDKVPTPAHWTWDPTSMWV